MYHLIYVSQAAAPMSEGELAEILSHSRQRNTKDGVTGLLIYRVSSHGRRGNFMQLLEGPEAAVRDVWQRIVGDRRHHTKIVLEEGPIAERTCPDWSMGFRNVDTGALSRFAGFADLGDEGFDARARAGEVSGALDLMRSFYHDEEDA